MKVTILIPNYKTVELTKLCLRLLRKHTPTGQARFLVIDNDSQDASLEYLRGLSWIDLIERKAISGEGPALSHSRALDLGLEQVETPYVLSIHTDTIVKRPDWLSYLVTRIESDPSIAGVGSWKLESKPFFRRVAKGMERAVQARYYALIGRDNHALEGMGRNHLYLRSHCALYRTDLLRRYGLRFSDGEAVAGKVMYQKLVDHGHRMIFLPSESLGQYVDHLNHATMIFNPQLGAREATVEKGLARIKRELARLEAPRILADSSLDN